MGKYIIAIKKGKEKFTSPEWTQQVQQISNVEVLSNYRDKRIVISCDEDGVLQIENELSIENFHIEPIIEHERSTVPKITRRRKRAVRDDESEE